MKEEISPTKTSEQTKSRSPRDRHQKKEKPKPLSKVIIRRLPPTMTEEEFLKQIDPLPEHESYYFAAADWSLGFDATCRAYINFRNHEDIFLFRNRFDGYVFVDSKGEEYPAIVEFAPFQGLPRNKARKCDPKVNTIESEAHYMNFLKKLEEDREAAKNESKLEFSLQPKDEKKVTSTPLLQFLMNRKIEKREEQKKRTEDNRRKRDEEKQKRRNRVSKGIPSSIKEESVPAKEGKEKVEGSPENPENSDNPEEKKNSRARRRAERNQRRREEHEQRRREIDAKLEQKALLRYIAKIEGPLKLPNQGKTAKQDNKRKEVKKYSERRGKSRSKNSPNSEAGTESETAAVGDSTSVATENRHVKDDNALMTFMKNVSNVKEFVPKHKQQLTEDQSDKLSVDMDEVKQKLENISLQKKQNQNSPSPERNETNEMKSERTERSQRNSSSSGGYAYDKCEDRGDRRIRNKDRPSIAIYQPGKTRLRLSEESNEMKSNPTSDTESVKKEERPNPARKVSRYSERRSGRNKDGKRRSSGDEKGLKLVEKSFEKQANETKRDDDKGEKVTE